MSDDVTTAPDEATVATVELGPIGPGEAEEATARHQVDIEYAQKAGDHYWVAVASYAIADPTTLADPAGNVNLDREHLLGLALGCYICEAPYDPRLLRRRCKGTPSRRHG